MFKFLESGKLIIWSNVCAVSSCYPYNFRKLETVDEELKQLEETKKSLEQKVSFLAEESLYSQGFTSFWNSRAILAKDR